MTATSNSATASTLAALLLAALAPSGCGSTTCAAGTEQKVDPATGDTVCVAPVPDGGNLSNGLQCGPNTMLVGGECVGIDPSKVCGSGTKFDTASGTCVGAGPTPCEPPPCPHPDNMHFCIAGGVRFLKDGTCTMGTKLQVIAVDPLGFLAGNKTPIAPSPVTTDDNGAYVIPNLPVPSQALTALAVSDVGGPMTYMLTASGANMISGGQTYRLDLFVVEKSTVANWDTQAGLAGGNTFEANGGYVARFRDAMGNPVAGVQLTFQGTVLPPSEAFYFKGSMKDDLSTLDKTLTMTDANAGAAIDLASTANGLGPYNGMGGGVTWPTMGALGTSTAGVIFVQTFLPATAQ